METSGIRKMIEDGREHYEKIFLEIEKASNRLEAAEKELNEREKQLQQRETQFEAEKNKFNKRKRMTLQVQRDLQVQLHLHDRYKAVNDKCVKLRKANNTLKADNANLHKAMKEIEQRNLTLRERNRNLEEQVKGLSDERDRHLDESTKAKEASVEQGLLIEDLKKQLMTMAAEAMCKVMAELYKEYLSGDHVNWDKKEMQEVIDTYEEMERLGLEGSPSGEADEEMNAGEDVDCRQGFW